MIELTMTAIVMCLASHACVYPNDHQENLGSAEQAEIIDVHGGCPPGTIGNGEICVDRWRVEESRRVADRPGLCTLI